MKFFKIILTIFLTFNLFACSSNQVGSVSRLNLDENSFTKFENADFEIFFPNSFNSKSNKSIIVFESKVKDLLFTPNLSIQKLNIEGSLNAIEEELISKAEKRLFDFEIIDSQTLEVASETGTQIMKLSMFSGRTEIELSKTEFIQAIVKDDKTLYVLTGAYGQSDNQNVAEVLKDSIKSFFLKSKV